METIYSVTCLYKWSLTDDLDFLFLARVLRTPACLAPPALSKRACIRSTWDMILFNCLVWEGEREREDKRERERVRERERERIRERERVRERESARSSSKLLVSSPSAVVLIEGADKC